MIFQDNFFHLVLVRLRLVYNLSYNKKNTIYFALITIKIVKKNLIQILQIFYILFYDENILVLIVKSTIKFLRFILHIII